MGAAAKGPIGVNQAFTAGSLQHGTGSIRIVRQTFPAGGAPGLSGKERFPLGQIRRQSGELELAALGSTDALAFNRTLPKLGIDSPHLRHSKGDGRFCREFSIHPECCHKILDLAPTNN
jgi:hypothetical protein